MAVVELKGEVAGVVVDADVLCEAISAEVAVAAPSEEALEEGDGFFGVFEVAEGLWFEAEVEVFTGFEREGLDEARAGVEVGEDEVFISAEFLKGAGEGGDGAAGVLRAELGDDDEEVIGVGEALFGGPVGLVDFFFDAGAVEGAVREAVDGEDVAVFLDEEGLEEAEVLAIGSDELGGGEGGETEADREGCAICDTVADGEDIGLEDLEGFRPGFCGVDVGAVGEVVLIAE